MRSTSARRQASYRLRGLALVKRASRQPLPRVGFPFQQRRQTLILLYQKVAFRSEYQPTTANYAQSQIVFKIARHRRTLRFRSSGSAIASLSRRGSRIKSSDGCRLPHLSAYCYRLPPILRPPRQAFSQVSLPSRSKSSDRRSPPRAGPKAGVQRSDRWYVTAASASYPSIFEDHIGGLFRDHHHRRGSIAGRD